MLTRQLTSSPSSLSALTSSNKRSFFPTRDILMDVSFFFYMFQLSFPQKVDTIIRRLRPLERAKRHTLTLKCVNFVNFVNFWKEKSHRSRDGIFLFIRSRIYSLPSGSCEVPSDDRDLLTKPPHVRYRATS